MSLRTRVLAGFALVAVVLGVVAVVVARTTESHLIDQVDAQLSSADDPVRGSYPPHDDGGGPGDGGDEGPGPISSFYVGFVSDASDSVATVFTPNLTGDDAPLPDIDADRARQAADEREEFTVGSDGSDVRYRVLARHDDRADGTVLVALPLDSVDDTVSRLIVVELLATVAILAVLALVAWWVVHLGVRPVKRMTAAASDIAAGDLSRRVPEAQTGTEAGDLGVALNRMLGSIEAAFDERTRSEDRLRRFVADASHELRTPVTTIRGYAELYRTGGLDDGDDLDEAMRRTEQEAVRMGTLVDDLLHLARLDQGRPMERAPVDLASVVADAARDARAVDPDRPVIDHAGDAVVVDGDEGRLRQVVANVVGNALVHTEPGTPLSITVDRREGRVVLEVADEGAGMAPEVAARAFERFYRADPARSRHRGGSGLGLAIVEATVVAHGGTVTLDSAPGRGTTVRIELPASS